MRRPCLVCGTPARGSYCERHAPRRPTTTERGLGHDHQRRRRALLPAAIGTDCQLCGKVMLDGQALDLDHSVPRHVDSSSVGDRIVHSSCNRRRRYGPHKPF